MKHPPNLTKELNIKEIVLGKQKKKKVKMFDRKKMGEIQEAAQTTNGRLELIRELVPLGLRAVNDAFNGGV